MKRHVAIKVFKSDPQYEETAERVTRIYRQLADGLRDHPGRKRVIDLLDDSELQGPNGRHCCLVTEVLGSVLGAWGEEPEASWEVARQLVEATAYLHATGVTHGGEYSVIAGKIMEITLSMIRYQPGKGHVRKFGFVGV